MRPSAPGSASRSRDHLHGAAVVAARRSRRRSRGCPGPPGSAPRTGATQSPAWSESSSSSAVLRAARTSSLSVVDDHAVGRRHGAGRARGVRRPFDLHGADEAGRGRLEARHVAQRRDADAEPPRRVEHGGARRRPSTCRPSMVQGNHRRVTRPRWRPPGRPGGRCRSGCTGRRRSRAARTGGRRWRPPGSAGRRACSRCSRR